jgi:cysteine synthase A
MDAPSTTRAPHSPGRGRVCDSIVDAVGDTPIVRLRKLPQMDDAKRDDVGNLEYFNLSRHRVVGRNLNHA